MTERVLVTGGCGFIARNLLPHLIERGDQVRVLDDESLADRTMLDDLAVEFVSGDICNEADVRDAVVDVDKVIHLAAYGSVVLSVSDPVTNFEVNARGTLNVMRACAEAGVRKVVFSSTGGALMGNTEPPVDETSVPKPVSPYGASKMCGEAYCNAMAGTWGLNTVVLRFGNIYGPWSAHKKGAITAFCKALLRDEPITIYGDGGASRDLLHVDDLCEGILAALDADLPPATTLHLASGIETTVLGMLETLQDLAGKPDHPVHFEPARRGEIARNFARFDRAREVLAFEPQVDARTGLERTWAWYRDVWNQYEGARASADYVSGTHT